MSEVPGERAENGVRAAVEVGGLGEARLEAVDGFVDGGGGALGVVLRSAAISPFELSDGFQVAEGLLFDRFDFGFRFEESFKLTFAAVEAAEGVGILAGQAAFLEPGDGVRRHSFAGVQIGQLRQGDLAAIKRGDFGDEVEGMDGRVGRVQQQAGNKGEAALVSEFGRLAGEGEAPGAQALAKGIEGR